MLLNAELMMCRNVYNEGTGFCCIRDIQKLWNRNILVILATWLWTLNNIQKTVRIYPLIFLGFKGVEHIHTTGASIRTNKQGKMNGEQKDKGAGISRINSKVPNKQIRKREVEWGKGKGAGIMGSSRIMSKFKGIPNKQIRKRAVIRGK